MNSQKTPAGLRRSSVRRNGNARWLAAVGVGLTMALTASCTNEYPHGPTGVAATRNSTAEVNPDSPKWNRFEVDVAIVTEGALIVTAKERRASLGSSYRLVRLRDMAGRWVTEHTFADLAPRANGVSRSRPARLVRVVTVPGEAPVFYDALGRRMTIPGIPTFPVSTESSEFPRSPTPLRTITLRSADQSIGFADTTREWLDHYVLTAAGVERVRGRLLAVAGAPDRSTPGKSRFVIERGDFRSEIEVNDETGTIDLLRTSSHGKVINETAREYERRDDGALVLKRERITRPDPRSGKVATTTIVTFSNIHVQESY